MVIVGVKWFHDKLTPAESPRLGKAPATWMQPRFMSTIAASTGQLPVCRTSARSPIDKGYAVNDDGVPRARAGATVYVQALV